MGFGYTDLMHFKWTGAKEELHKVWLHISLINDKTTSTVRHDFIFLAVITHCAKSKRSDVGSTWPRFISCGITASTL